MTSKDNIASYRGRIYEKYAGEFQSAGTKFNVVAAERWAKGYRWYLRDWLPTHQDAAIAELGCGWGKMLHYLKSRGYENIVGIDLSPDQIQLASAVTPNVEMANVLEWLAGKDEAFDLIVALDLIEHLEKQDALTFLDLCFAALRPGGRLVLQTPNADSPFGSQIRYGDFTHEFSLTPKLLAFLLHQSGFKNVEAREQGPIPIGYGFLSTTRYILWRLIRFGITSWNIVETGASGKVLTRVFMSSAVKPAGTSA